MTGRPDRWQSSYQSFDARSHTAKEANRILGRTGEPFWQRESYDHWVRNDRERVRIHDYIVNNPVKAGLVERPEDWPWSSASRNRWSIGLRPSAEVAHSATRHAAGVRHEVSHNNFNSIPSTT